MRMITAESMGIFLNGVDQFPEVFVCVGQVFEIGVDMTRIFIGHQGLLIPQLKMLVIIIRIVGHDQVSIYKPRVVGFFSALLFYQFQKQVVIMQTGINPVFCTAI